MAERSGRLGWLVLAFAGALVPLAMTVVQTGVCADGVDPAATRCEVGNPLGAPGVVVAWIAWAVLAAWCVSRFRRSERVRRRRTRFSAPSAGPLATVAVPLPPRGFAVEYAPRRNGEPDAGEVVWAVVPYAEDPTQSKDRPLLVIARESPTHVLALKLTSQDRTASRDHVSIGAGPWDAQGRESWVAIDQLYRVHRYGIRREAGVLPRDAFERLGEALARRHGWVRAE